MKILLVSNFFPPSHNAGTEKRTLGYALELKKLGFDPQVLCAGNWDVGNQYWNGISDTVYREIPVRRINFNWNLAPDPNHYLYNNPIVADHVSEWLTVWEPDLVHVTSCYSLSASIIQKAKDCNLPLVLTLTDYWFICPKHTLLRSDGSLCNGRTSSFDCQNCMLGRNKTYQQYAKYLPNGLTAKSLDVISKNPKINKIRGMRGLLLNMDERKRFLENIIHLPDQIIAPSQHLADVFKASGVSRKITVIKSGHDLSWLEDYPGKDHTHRIRFGYIGQIAPIKGLSLLVSAFAQIPNYKEVELLIYGDQTKDPSYTEQLVGLIKDSGKDISICGSFPHNQLGEVLSGIDVLIVPSLWHENNPRVIQEAFASKTPVIASDVGGISEFVKHGVNGLLFERGNMGSLSNQIIMLTQEPDLIEELRSAIMPVKTIQIEVEEIVNIYKSISHSRVEHHW